MSWLQSGIRLIYRRYALEWDIHEQITITQVTRARLKVKVNRRYISGWSLYPFQDRHHHARTVTLDRQTGKVIEAETHPFYRRLWLNPHVTIGDSIPISIRIKDPTELLFTVKGLDLKTVDMNHFNCWRFEASFQNEHYRIWYDDQDGLRIRFEALRQISQHQFSAHTVWQLQQIHMS